MDVKTHLPITETTFFILLSVSAGPTHGYAIMKDVRTLSSERIILSTGTLYGALKRLLDQGWISRADDRDCTTDQRKRKSYQLTILGKKILAAEIERLGDLVGVAQQRIVGGQT